MRHRALFLGLLLAAILLPLSACAAEEIAEEEPAYYRVTFYMDDQPLTWKRLAEGSVIRLVPQRDGEGNQILRWLDEEGDLAEPDGMTVTRDMDFYAYEPPALHTGSHIAYMGDIASVWFRPDIALRREEAAQILYTLMERPETEQAAPEAEQEDSEETEEAETEPAGPVDPGVPLTSYQPTFSDVSADGPYYTAIQTVASYHLMGGYPDGTFRPEQAITRAEFVSMLAPYGEPAVSDGTDFADVPAEHWAADAIATAVNSGWLEGFTDGKFYPDQPLTRTEAVVIINRLLGYGVDERAINTVVPIGVYVDVFQDHWGYYDILDATYSSELLAYIRGEVADAEPGFIYIGDKLYHLNEELKLDYYEAGFHVIDNQLRYCGEDGYKIDEFDYGRQEIDGSMYWVMNNGAFMREGYHGYLYFGEDGRYTSGDEHLDEMVEEFLDGILDNGSMSQYDKLYAAYYRVKNSFGYVNRGDGYQFGSTGWTKKCAVTMFEERSGHCYYWAAAYMYIARRLGYQAYAVSGIAGTLGSWHAWVMIDWPDGNEYIFDPELEWSYERGFVDNGRVQYRDFFMQPFYASETLYTFADGSHTTQR